MESRRQLINTSPAEPLSIQRQCALLGLSRSTFYYEAAPANERELAIMRAIDELHLDYPFFGYRRLATHLEDCLSDAYRPVNTKMIRRLMQIMDIHTLCPKPNLSKRHPDH